MVDGPDALTGRVQTIEMTLESLVGNVNDLSTSVNRRFDAVDAAIVEQRQYTEFAFSHLDRKMDAGFARLDEKIDSAVARIERKLDQFIDVQLETNTLVDRRLRALERPDRP